MIGFARLLFAAVACLAVFVRVEGAQAIRVAYCSEPGVCYNRAGEPRGGVVVDWMDRISRSLGRPVEWVDVTQSRAEEMLADSSRTFDMSRFDLVLTKPVTGEKLKKSLADLFPRLFADAEKREE